jgi:hypothetical protein
MNPIALRSLVLACSAAALALAGCSGEKQLSMPERYPVHGKVTLKGEPVHYVNLRLEPVSGGGLPAEAWVGEDGSYSVRTFSNDGIPDGATVGEFEVILGGDEASGLMPKGATPTALPPGGLRTGITIEVTATDNEIDIDIP